MLQMMLKNKKLWEIMMMMKIRMIRMTYNGLFKKMSLVIKVKKQNVPKKQEQKKS